MMNKDKRMRLSPEVKRINKLDKENLPWSLLLTAAPEKEKVQQYIDSGFGFTWQKGKETCGVIVVVTRENEFEIMNLAVANELQGTGIGLQLLKYALKEIQKKKTTQQEIIVRTGSTSSVALHLYKKVGFVECARDKDYFLINYKELIYENGNLLREQVTLKKQISHLL
ncbi:MAG: GNAT family N-acetyltransferase [Enterococcus lacertideformus]|uniref:GNAT family N-acetyltransferase n=1 Tax=Enterococcus lacertideformus TaxID=2771493 RepID=A0A931AWW6_9ENTE|nr:GNAT family N-acetyltransferase [Enterococcus lacertideformus]